MGTIAETENVDSGLSVVDQGKQTSVSVGREEREVAVFR
jgi:hypothetical protein